MSSPIRIIGVGGVIAYRALFNWTTPAMFVGTLLFGPLLQLLFFAHLGRQLQVADDGFYIVGNAVLAASAPCVFGGTMAVSNERRYGTLGHVLLSPRSRTATFLGRVLPYAGNGLIVAGFTLAAGSTLLRTPIGVSALPPLALALGAGALSCGFFGLALGAIGLRLRDVWLVSNVSVAALLLLTGVNVPADRLPAPLRGIGQAMPITHAAQAARELAAGEGLGRAAPAIITEFVVAFGYAVLAAVLLRIFEAEGRRRASLDTV